MYWITLHRVTASGPFVVGVYAPAPSRVAEHRGRLFQLIYDVPFENLVTAEEYRQWLVDLYTKDGIQVKQTGN